MFTDEMKRWNIPQLMERSRQKNSNDVEQALRVDRIGPEQMAALLSPAAGQQLEKLARRSREITLARFGKTIQLFTPIYLSNYCHNSCLYCGFNKNNTIDRKLQSVDEVEEEARFLKDKEGFKNLLLVAGEDKNVDIPYLAEVIKRLHTFIPSLSLEIAPRTVEEYKALTDAGSDGIVVFQETYDEENYKKYHPTGKKADYQWRLETPDRIGQSGFHRVGIGVLMGLTDPLYDIFALYLHARYLIRTYWRTQVAISVPRIRKATGAITPPHPVDDRFFTQIICALRIALPDVGVVLSTREEPRLRDGLMKVGVTQISAGSRTEPGGYLKPQEKGEQFSVEDSRSPGEMVKYLQHLGYDPVWKDWEGALNDKVQGQRAGV